MQVHKGSATPVAQAASSETYRQLNLFGTVFERVRADYVEVMANHRNALAALAAAVGWTFTRHRTDHSPQSALLALFEVLTEMPES